MGLAVFAGANNDGRDTPLVAGARRHRCSRLRRERGVDRRGSSSAARWAAMMSGSIDGGLDRRLIVHGADLCPQVGLMRGDVLGQPLERIENLRMLLSRQRTHIDRGPADVGHDVGLDATIDSIHTQWSVAPEAGAAARDARSRVRGWRNSIMPRMALTPRCGMEPCAVFP